MTTPLFTFDHIAIAATAYLTHNETVDNLEAVATGLIEDRTLTAPPGSPAEGDLYIPAATATGAWAGLEDLIVQWRNNVWKVITPFTDFFIYSKGDTSFIQWDGAAWQLFSVAPGSTDENVKISANDTTADFLGTKLVAGSGVTLTELNDGANETLQVSATSASPFASTESLSQASDISLNGSNPYQYIQPTTAINVDIDDLTTDAFYRIRSLDGSNVITVRDETNTTIFLLGNAVDNGSGVEQRLMCDCHRIASGTLVCNLY